MTEPAAEPGPGAGALAAAVRVGLAGAGLPSLIAGVERLMAAYRSGEVPAAPVVATRMDAAAYATYRMPATVAATSAAIGELELSLPGWQPRSLLDFGAGTGGATWAAVSRLAGLRTLTLLEQSAEAIRLGRAIFAQAQSEPLRSAIWRLWRLSDSASLPAAEQSGASHSAADLPGADLPGAGQPGAGQAGAGQPGADLAIAAYVLGELTEAQQAALVGMAVAAAPAVLLVEPGTPAGHRRILAARGQLLAAGYQLAAPCPHQLSCPLDVAGDWCHLGARLPRSAVHRQVKGAELSYEDEKFSYVAARRPDPGAVPPDRPAGRVVRRPQQRKGLVLLDLCASDGSTRRELVSKSKGEAYRRARKTSWGDRWA